MLKNIAMLSEAAALATSPGVDRGVVQSRRTDIHPVLFVDILHAHNVQVKLFDVRKVMRAYDHCIRAGRHHVQRTYPDDAEILSTGFACGTL